MLNDIETIAVTTIRAHMNAFKIAWGFAYLGASNVTGVAASKMFGLSLTLYDRALRG